MKGRKSLDVKDRVTMGFGGVGKLQFRKLQFSLVPMELRSTGFLMGTEGV